MMQTATWNPSTKMHTVELLKIIIGGKEGDEMDFHTKQEALEYGALMLRKYKYRVWINGVEYTLNDFKQEGL